MGREYSTEAEAKHIDSKFIFNKKNIRECGVAEKLGLCTQAEKAERKKEHLCSNATLCFGVTKMELPTNHSAWNLGKRSWLATVVFSNKNSWRCENGWGH